MVPNTGKDLGTLYDEWKDCTKCALGERRVSVGGSFVFGEGTVRSILFVGEGPGRIEEKEGHPFVGDSGNLLRMVLQKLGVTEYYLTNCVCCRSCSALTNPDGSPITKQWGNKRVILYKDEAPANVHVEACLPRLYEEIYLVDPIVIVALGARATEVLGQRHVQILSERGKEEHITIPGASYVPVRTEKREAWIRIEKTRRSEEDPTFHVGHLFGRAPVEQNQVRYLMIPTIHPAYVLRRQADKGKDSPVSLFVNDVRLAVKVYERYLFETRGVVPTGESDLPEDQIHIEEELNDGQE